MTVSAPGAEQERQAYYFSAGLSLGGTILQTTTIAPKETYGGQIIVEKPKASAPYVVEVNTRWNGEVYSFRFNVAVDN